ncbi:MAG: DNA-directed RNA polymerase subunit beta', partial [Patescibacteria group bacterium]
DLNRVIYFAGYMITKVNDGARDNILEQIDKEYKSKAKSKNKKTKDYLKSLKEMKDRAVGEVSSIKMFHVLSESEYQRLSTRFGELFEASMGAEAVRRAFGSLDLNKLNKELVK